MSYLTTHLTKRQSRFTLFLTVFLAIVLWLSFPVSMTASPMAVGGTGPGGVGATTGLDTLELWLRSDMPVYSDTGCNTEQTTDGNAVACWPDYSGNDFEAVQATLTNQPTFQNGSGDTLNGYPMLRWDGDDILTTLDNVTLGPLSVFVVYNATEEGYIYVHSPNVNDNNGSYIYTETGASYSVRRSGAEGFENLTTGWGQSATARILTHQYNGTVSTHSLILNGVLQVPGSTGPNDPGTASASDVFSIGGRSADGALRITGNFAEVIAYNDYLNTAQRVLVENYLQAKFNDSTVDNITISSDRYDGDTTANENFDLDVAGIGQEVDGSHTEAHSAGMIVVDSGFLQDNGDYLMFGHRTSVNSNVFTELPSTGVWSTAPDPVRWDRHWYIDVTDVNANGGTVDIIFDFNEGGMGIGAPTNIPANYRLLRRSDINSDFEDLVGATSVDIPLKRVIFANVSVTDLGSNFTLGSLDGSASPTTITMQSAAATLPTPPWFIVTLVLFTLGVSAVVVVARGRKA
jgi:hypothetical protein